MPNPKKARSACLNCKKETARSGYKYCSNKCQIEYQHKIYIQKWKDGEIIGLQRLGIVSVHIKNYLREKFSDKCCLCGWARINAKLGYSPLVADHVDGNWRNNGEGNLRLICPNCDALTLTYGGMNRGKGRENRALSKRTVEARVYVSKKPN
jgi:hypothetical protein